MDSCFKWLTFLLCFILLASCATLPQHSKINNSLAYTVEDDQTITSHFFPIFVIENYLEKHNLIGTPKTIVLGETERVVFVDPEKPTIYTESRTFATQNDTYTNLIYRIHFEKVPFSLIPFNIGWGKNVGIIVVVTLNSKAHPVLYTTVQTCGCYLSFVPTSYMPLNFFPDDWNKESQRVYWERLPGLLDFTDIPLDQAVTIIVIKSGSHRVKEIKVLNVNSFPEYKVQKARIQPLNSLQKLSLEDKGTTSFYENSKYRKGYVKGSSKPWERLLISWWALDWNVGQDKKLGKDKADGPTFYTSLKPWAREDSDMRVFPDFLKYWGWKL